MEGKEGKRQVNEDNCRRITGKIKEDLEMCYDRLRKEVERVIRGVMESIEKR